jgi:predicted RNase H-like HicB family nuclease/uncharacterized damage-inducible protein DinB
MKTYRVYIETSQETIDEGGPLAHVPELPGCTARARTMDTVKAAIRQVIRDHLVSLRLQGEHNLPSDFDLEFEEVKGYTLPPDHMPLTPEELEKARRWLEASRRAVLEELTSLPAEAWDWKPCEKGWPLRTVASHMGAAELYLTDKLMEPDRAPLDRLQVTRRVALDRLDALTLEQFGQVTTFGGEDWTPRKVLRRMLEHEQEHLVQIRDLISQFCSNRQDADSAKE